MDEKLKVLARKTLSCDQPDQIVEFFRQFRPFKVVVEATASYLWFVELLEPLAEEVVLANPKKLRVIAESTKKTDRLDAQVLAEFLARDMIPRGLHAHAQAAAAPGPGPPSPVPPGADDLGAVQDPPRPGRLQRRPQGPLLGPAAARLTSSRSRSATPTSFVIKQLWSRMGGPSGPAPGHDQEDQGVRRQGARAGEAEARAILKTAPGVGFVTAEVVLSELGDVSRFGNAKTVCAYAGLVPAVRQSGGKRSKDLHITKEGSGLLRWALVESAWRLVRTSPKWSAFYSRLKKRCGSKRAIVAVARKLLCVLYAMLKTSTPYKIIPAATRPRHPSRPASGW